MQRRRIDHVDTVGPESSSPDVLKTGEDSGGLGYAPKKVTTGPQSPEIETGPLRLTRFYTENIPKRVASGEPIVERSPSALSGKGLLVRFLIRINSIPAQRKTNDLIGS